MLPTPDTSHLCPDQVYDPAEDTFLLLDALESDESLIKSLDATIALEIGSGSGCVSTFLSRIVGPSNAYINPEATHTTIKTAQINGVDLECIQTDLIHGLERVYGSVDILVFNPPYVVTPPEEVGSQSIEAAWAGGIDGRQVTDRLLPLIPKLMAPNGLFYLVTIKENRPQEIMDWMESKGFSAHVALSRRAGIEGLSILRFQKNLNLNH